MDKIICISGKSNCGKDTTANFIKQEIESKGKKVLIAHYADLVKYICKTFFDWNGEKDEKGRTLLQYVGTDVVREKYPDYWVEFIIDMIELFGDNWDYMLIPDTRFPNEISVLKNRFNSVTHLKISRPNFVSPLTLEQQNHPSETALDGVEPDWTIINGSFDGLKKTVNNFVKNVLEV